VASLAQYEAKSGNSLPVISIILDSFDSIQESNLTESIESIVSQVLREGASLGIYLAMTALRANSFKLAINSNLPTRMALFLVEDNGVREVVGREALIAQEVIGRGQIKTEEGVHEFQIYLPSSGSNDIERLTAMEEEIKAMAEEWDGEVPSAIPMLPNVVELSAFYQKKGVQAMLHKLELPLALDKETTNVVGFIPKKHGYFLIAEDTVQQSESLTRTVLEGFKYLGDRVNKYIFNAGGRFTQYEKDYGELIDESEYVSFLTELSTEIDERQEHGWDIATFVYIPEAHLLNNHILTALELFKKVLGQGARNGIYIIFQGVQRSIESGFDEFNKRLRSNIPAGIFGTRVTDQNLVNVKIRIGEPIVALDEAYYFEIRDIKHIKLNQ
jgi:ftsK/spoIIIE family cell division protein